MDQRRLDDILNNALDELDDDDESISESESDSGDDGEEEEKNDDDDDYANNIQIQNTKRSKDNGFDYGDNINPRPVFGPPRPPPQTTEDDAMDEMLREMEALLDIPPNNNNDGATPPPPSSTARSSSSSSSSSTPKTHSKKTPSSSSKSETEMDSTVTKLLQELSRPPTSNADSEKKNHDDRFDPSQFGGIGEDMMNEMAAGWEDAMNGGGAGVGGGTDSSVEHVVDGMLRQLLGKELMYEPMRDICDKFPKWLVEHKAELSDEEYQRYGRQYQCFQRIVEVYERDPDNFARLSELMQDIQEYGQPPAELIQELAPGLEFDERGMPKMDAFANNLGGGMDPNSLPFGKDGDAQCCTM